jgi:hypothetical protein
MNTKLLLFALTVLVWGCQNPKQEEAAADAVSVSTTHEELIDLFEAWRAFENPPFRDGAPDYTAATFTERHPEFLQLQAQLNAFDTTGWSIPERVDWMIVWAEMNGYDFNYRVLKPWERDPAFYKSLWMARSDVPGHEGPTHHAVTEIWQYEFPLSEPRRKDLLSDLKVIPALNEQARQNLTGNARDLWVAGIRDIRTQSANLQSIKDLPGLSDDPDMLKAIDDAIGSTDALAAWLEEQSSSKTGPSGIGKENYTWYMQNVHLVPLSWEDEVMILKRELARAWSALKMEEHLHRNEPPLLPVTSPEAYDAMALEAAESLLGFLEREQVVTVKDYYRPALMAHLGQYIPEATRNFFYITSHHDPRPLFSHFYHWFEIAQLDLEPHESPIRREPLLYNIFDSHNEGMATAVEELFMQMGLYEDSPRSREIVYIMLAQRAARGLGSLYAHANEMTMEEAGGIHSEYTPRGWMKTEKELLIFEQHLYLRQPGYGTSYVTGKYLLDAVLADYGRMKELNNEPFVMQEFFDEINEIGSIPMALGHWQMTGKEAWKPGMWARPE